MNGNSAPWMRSRHHHFQVLMVTHNASTLGAVSHVAVIVGGRLADFGERDEVLKRHSPQKDEPAPIHVTTKLERSVS